MRCCLQQMLVKAKEYNNATNYQTGRGLVIN